jgi:rubrerythrin
VSGPAATRRGLLAAAGTLGLGAALARPAAAQPERTDVEILEELLALENRLTSAYEGALRRKVIDPALGEMLRDQEREHIRGLEQALGRLEARSPEATVPEPGLRSALRSRDAFARYALGLEQRAAGAYARAAAEIRRPGLRRPLGSIMTSEAAHQVALRAASGRSLL